MLQGRYCVEEYHLLVNRDALVGRQAIVRRCSNDRVATYPEPKATKRIRRHLLDSVVIGTVQGYPMDGSVTDLNVV